MNDVKFLAKNQWTLPISNYGMFGNNPLRNSAGGEWPRGSGHLYIFGAGIWFGRLKKYADHTDTNVTVGYNPSSGKAEFSPGAIANAGSGYGSRTFERVYMYPEDWPPHPGDFPKSMQDSWRTSLKVATPSGDTIHGWFLPIPRNPVSTGDCWSVFNDGDVSNMEGTKPRSCSIEVYQYTYDWTLPWNRDVIFFSCNVKNVGPDTLRDCYMGMCCDGDIGVATNDFAGLIRHKWIHNAAVPPTDSIFVDNVGMEWSGPEPWPTYPGVLAFDFLQSPYKRDNLGRVPGIDGIDNNGNGLIDEPAEGEQIGMTSYKIFTLTGGDPAGDGQQYQAMQGWSWFIKPPVLDSFDSLDNSAADKRFLQSSGSFNIAPDSMVTLTIGIMCAPLSHLPSDRDTSFYSLAVTDRAAQQAYDNNWVSPVPPPSPNFVLQPGVKNVTIMWDNSPENAADNFYTFAPSLNSPYYRQYDFQGYKLYRSRTGNVGDWALLGQWDRKDGIVFEDTFAKPAPAESIRSKATDTGLFYAYIDSSNLRYGFPYYYAVTSFDYNTLGKHDPAQHLDTTHLSLESGMQPQTVVMRTEAANYRPPWDSTRQTAGNSSIDVAITPTVIAPQAIKTASYQVHFGPPTTNPGNNAVYHYYLTGPAGESIGGEQTFAVDLRKHTDTSTLSPVTLYSTVFDSVLKQVKYDSVKDSTHESRAWLPVLQIQVKVTSDFVPQQVFDSVHVASGSYPSSRFGFPVGSYPPNADRYLWAYRGNAYRVVWKRNAQGNLTAEVTDLNVGQLVAFRRMVVSGAGMPDSAAGWCLYDTVGSYLRQRRPSDTLSLFRTKTMYINGGFFDLDYRGDSLGFPIEQPLSDGDTWIVYPLRINPAPVLATYEVATKPAEFAAEKIPLHVKVVPNPYLVRNEWERHPDFRKLKFINLPSSCVIRIYTMSGDLIKTLRHDATNAGLGSLPDQQGGDEDWDLLTSSGQKPAPGVYLFHIDSPIGKQIGKFAIVY